MNINIIRLLFPVFIVLLPVCFSGCCDGRDAKLEELSRENEISYDQLIRAIRLYSEVNAIDDAESIANSIERLGSHRLLEVVADAGNVFDHENVMISAQLLTVLHLMDSDGTSAAEEYITEWLIEFLDSNPSGDLDNLNIMKETISRYFVDRSEKY